MSVEATLITSGGDHYATEADLDNVFGDVNVTKWSDIENAAARDDARIELALEYADAQIDQWLGGLLVTPITTTGAGTVLLTDWAAKLAGVWLYQHRGHRDDNVDGNKYTEMAEDVRREIGLYAMRLRTLPGAAYRWTDNATSPAVFAND